MQEYSDGILELINFLCEVLGQDEHIRDEVIALKKNCLKYLNKSYYSEEAQFKEPTIALRLHDLFCRECHIVSDLDLFNDQLLSSPEIPCAYCLTPFPGNYLEHKLIRFVHDNLTFSQIQDLYCRKCSKAKNDLLPKSCACSGHFAIDKAVSHNPFLENYQMLVQNMRLIAEQFQMHFLSNVIESLQPS